MMQGSTFQMYRDRLHNIGQGLSEGPPPPAVDGAYFGDRYMGKRYFGNRYFD